MLIRASVIDTDKNRFLLWTDALLFFIEYLSSSLQECPSGVVNEETFKHIYAQFFPHGGSASCELLSFSLFSHTTLFSARPDMSLSGIADASMYAHYLFNAFDTTNNGSIKFKVSKKR